MRGYKSILLLLTLIFCVGIQGQYIQAKPSATTGEYGTNTMFIENISGMQDSLITIDVNMVNDVDVTTFQFDLYLPDGLTIVENEGSPLITLSNDRKTPFHTIECYTQPSGAMRVISYSMDNSVYKLSEGTIVKIQAKVSSSMSVGEHNITMKNIRLVKPDAKELVTVSSTSLFTVKGLTPSVYTLTLRSIPEDAGSFNINTETTYTQETNVSLRAYKNNGFDFVGWELDGEIISTSMSLVYTMPTKNIQLTARYEYNPDNPSEPDVPVIPLYSTLNLAVTPSEAGYISLITGNKYEVSTIVNISAYNYTNFKFKNWTCNGVVISTDYSFSYTMQSGNPTLVANYEYAPDNPGEPQEPLLYHTLTIESNPVEGGYFNIPSGNKYQANSIVNLSAYSHRWYKFKNWTIGDSVISTSGNFSYKMPACNVTLTANYTYDYNPDDPDDPDKPTTKNTIYGMTENCVRGQKIVYPIYLENTPSVRDVSFTIQFPEGFIVTKNEIQLAGRASTHTMTIDSLSDNKYSFKLTSENVFDNANGKILDIPVNIPDTAAMAFSHPVTITNAIVTDTLNAMSAVSIRSGYIYVEKATEEGLYAKFSYDKLHGRVKFTNLSSEKAISYTWDFGDGNTSSEKSPMHTYSSSGYYTVKLKVTGATTEDTAESIILINDESTWKAGGTYFLADKEYSVRHFTSAESLLDFISVSQTVTEDINIKVGSDRVYMLDINDDNLSNLEDMRSKISSSSNTLHFTPIEEDNTSVVALGSAEDDITPALIELFNNFAGFTTSENVKMMLCGIEFNPGMIKTYSDQTVASGVPTKAFNFARISRDIDFQWTLVTVPDTTTVNGFLTSGADSIPSMTIINIGTESVTLTYHIVAAYNGTTFCEFDKNITIISADDFVYESEWNILVAIKEHLTAGGWNTPWNMSAGIASVGSLHGVTIDHGYVVDIDLSMQGITSTFPVAALQLQRLKSLSFAHNKMSGDVARDILQAMTIIMEGNPEYVSQLTNLNLSDNKFSGNIGLLSSLSSVFANLETLNASGNLFADLYPVLPLSITNLNLSGQSTDAIVNTDINNITTETVRSLPRILTYNHQEQMYNLLPSLRLTNYRPTDATASGSWGIEADASSGTTTLRGLEDYVYKGQSGDTLYLSYPDADVEVESSYCRTIFNFSIGDANFLGGVDATDLQSTILYIFGEYANRPFNFTAANTYVDNNINVQDVIKTVDILLQQNAEDTITQIENSPMPQATSDALEAAAEIIAENGQIKLRTSTPVAAICIHTAGDVQWNIKPYGLEQTTSKGTLVGYSFIGGTLPAGENIIGTYNGEININRVSLSDNNADNIPVNVKNGQITSIDNIMQENGEVTIYDLTGGKHDKMNKGINIIKSRSNIIKIYNNK